MGFLRCRASLSCQRALQDINGLQRPADANDDDTDANNDHTGTMMVMMTMMMARNHMGCTCRDAPGTMLVADATFSGDVDVNRAGDGARTRHCDADCDVDPDT